MCGWTNLDKRTHISPPEYLDGKDPSGSAGLYLHFLCLVWIYCYSVSCIIAELKQVLFSFNHTFMTHTGSIPPLSGCPCGVTVAVPPPCRVLFFGCLSWGRESWLNEWLSYRHPLLPSLTCFLPQIATSLSLPLSISLPRCENSFIPVWTGIRIAVRQKTREREETNPNKQFGNRHAIRAEFIEASDFLPPLVPRWAVLQSCVEPVAISDCRRCSGLGWMPSCCRKNWWSGCCAHEWEQPGRR